MLDYDFAKTLSLLLYWAELIAAEMEIFFVKTIWNHGIESSHWQSSNVISLLRTSKGHSINVIFYRTLTEKRLEYEVQEVQERRTRT